jgi:glutaconate CoA-transferase subunit A
MAGVTLGELQELAARVPDGASIALFKEQQPVALVRALIAGKVRDLHLVTVPTGGLAADLLIGAGCARTVETSGVTLGEHGPAPAFVAAVKAGEVRPLDATCPAIYAALQAGEKGQPFAPLRGVLGTDVLRHRSDWKVIQNPFGEDDPVLVLPALRPDVALLHAAKADRDGNVWTGPDEAIRLMARAAHRVLVTVEEVVETNLMADPLTASGTLPNLYVEAVAEAPGGAWPLAMPNLYAEDSAAIRRYVERARSGSPAATWLEPVAAAA